jgi:hypothetical protein
MDLGSRQRLHVMLTQNIFNPIDGEVVFNKDHAFFFATTRKRAGCRLTADPDTPLHRCTPIFLQEEVFLTHTPNAS